MRRLIFLFLIAGCFTTLSDAQHEEDPPPPFEVYGLASGMKTVDATGTLVVVNPGPNQVLGFTASGLASGARAGLFGGMRTSDSWPISDSTSIRIAQARPPSRLSWWDFGFIPMNTIEPAFSAKGWRVRTGGR